jgi:hypothetical protein
MAYLDILKPRAESEMAYLDILKPTAESEIWRNIPYEEGTIHSSMGRQLLWKINIKKYESVQHK